MNFLEKVRASIADEHLISRNARVLVAVSGGMDSMALLHALVSLRHEWGVELIVAHYDHALRRSSGRDRRFVERAARTLGLKFVTEVNRLRAPAKGSLEEFARDRRYDFLMRAAKKLKADAVALAHHEDDQAETVLLRVLRGTGLMGLQSMVPRRLMGNVVFIRPFLRITRREIEIFLRSRKIAFVKDPTNDSLRFMRNKARRHLIPLIEKGYSSAFKKNLADLARTTTADYAFIEAATRKTFKSVTRVSGKTVTVDLSRYGRLPLAIQRMTLRLALESVRGDLRVLTFGHIQDVETLLEYGRDGTRLDLPAGVVVVKRSQHAIVTSQKSL